MQEAKHALEQFQSFTGDVALYEVDALTIHGFAEHIGKDKSKKTIQKKVGYVRRMFDHGVRKGWLATNVFFGIKLDPKLGKETKSFIPLTQEELEALFKQAMGPHLRCLLSLLITTGMRLDEGALLDWEDVKYDKSQDVLYFDRVGAKVKNRGSLRKVPVHPALTWAKTGRTGAMFPEFPRDRDGKTQGPASKELMRLVRNVTDHDRKVVHSLRGNFKDMLRDAGVPKEVNDFITGHGSGDVAGKYGEGPSLRVRKEAVEQLSFPYL